MNYKYLDLNYFFSQTEFLSSFFQVEYITPGGGALSAAIFLLDLLVFQKPNVHYLVSALQNNESPVYCYYIHRYTYRS